MDIKTTCLAILSRGDASGYEIKKTFEDGPFCHIQDAGFGSIYPALGQLRDDGLVTVTEMSQNGRPGKKVHAITPAGRMALVDALAEPSVPDRFRSDFLFRMLFAHLISPNHLEATIEARLSDLREAVVRMENCACSNTIEPSEKFVNGMGLSVYRAMIDYIEDHKIELIGATLLAGAAQ